jgi:RNA polymerase sigma factor (sigma-70 family)
MNGKIKKELIDNIIKGDIEQYSIIVNEYKDAIFRLALRFTHNHDNAEDSMQEIFLKAYEKLGTFKGKSEFGTWLYRVAVNILLSKCNSNNPDNNYEILDQNNLVDSKTKTPEKLLENIELKEHMVKAIDLSTSPREKIAIILRYQSGYDIKEIAAIMKVTKGTVKKLLHRGLKKLKNYLGNNYEYF